MPARPNIGIFTQPISFIGLPVVSVPVWLDGARLPIGGPGHRTGLAGGSRPPSRLRLGEGRRRESTGSRRSRGHERERAIGWAEQREGRAPATTSGRRSRRPASTSVRSGAASRTSPALTPAAAWRLAETPAWKAARVVKCNPDPPQIPVRLRALHEGKVLYAPVPELTKRFPFVRLDPAELAADGVDFETAATIAGLPRLGRAGAVRGDGNARFRRGRLRRGHPAPAAAREKAAASPISSSASSASSARSDRARPIATTVHSSQGGRR